MSDGKTPAVDQVTLAPVVEQLCRDAASAFGAGGRVTLPSRQVVILIVEDLRAVLVPGYFGTSDLHDESLHYFVGATLARRGSGKVRPVGARSADARSGASAAARRPREDVT